MSDTRAPEPMDIASEADLLIGWLAFHRDALAAKCAGMSDEQLTTRSAEPSDLSLLGLIRHMTEMEHHYLVRSLSDGSPSLVYCTDDEPDADILGLQPAMVEPSMRRWRDERAAADVLIARFAADLSAPVSIGRQNVRWHLLKVLQEYARHNGHADIVRERIDGAVGE